MSQGPVQPSAKGNAMNTPYWPTYRTTQDPREEDAYAECGNILERNGIWVVTINGIWRGDYTRRENAVAAVQAAGIDAW